ncbi:LysE family translocator [Kribbella pittospori]|uniref:LysE family translocator n=1 Tax=Kribbella pittospori TaxID=722689 RepID=A0A4R0KRG1_9ACTN|nr:LysE family translocator [Kribbella pittospori]TCC63451.1 LysE family translocator [Kribbella pittospori]
MIHRAAVAGFAAAVLPLIATPGASLTLLIRHVSDGGRRRAVPVISGTVSGLYVHASLAMAGLSVLVMQSSRAFTAVKLVGATYLIGLGLWNWYSASSPASLMTTRRRLPRSTESLYGQALLANVLNPKAASIYLTLIPQFIAPSESVGGQILALATAHALLIALWLLLWTIVIRRASPVLRGARSKLITTRITSVVLIGLGIRTAATTR